MNISDKTVALSIFLMAIGASIFYWFTVRDVAGTIFCFIFISSIACLMLLNGIAVNHTKASNILRKFGFLPSPTESGMLVLALTTLVLISVNNFWVVIFEEVKQDSRMALILLYILCGMFLSVYHAFSTRKKNTFEEGVLRFYLAITLIALSLSTAFFVMQNNQPGYLVFVIWNLLQASILYLTARFLPNDYLVLPSSEAKLKESAMAILLVSAFVLIGHFILHEHWAVIFSSIIFAWNVIQQLFKKELYLK